MAISGRYGHSEWRASQRAEDRPFVLAEGGICQRALDCFNRRKQAEQKSGALIRKEVRPHASSTA
jgi:hypothetical protein